jgi:hypothetical protein
MHKQAIERLGRDLGDLLARHERGRSLGEFAAYSNDPIGFIREVLHGEPWSRQVEIAESVRDSPLVVVRSANAVGKDWIAARLALWWVYCRRGLALVTGPTERQVREVVMGEVARAFHAAKDLPGELYQMALRLGRTETAGILAFTSTEASRLTGFHAPRILAILTEAQGVEDFAWEGLLACATGSEDRVLAVGNPLSPSGRFYSVSRSTSWRSLRISAEEHPNLLNGGQPIPGGPSREFMQRIASEFGEGSGIYRARVLGDFPDEGEEGLIRRSWLEEAAERFHRREFRLEAARAVPIIAVDPARYGPDYTVLAVRRGPVLQEIVAWGQVSTMETVGRLQAELRRVGVLPDGSGYVIVDEVGLGAGVLDRLKEIGYRYHAYPFNGGRRAHDQPRFLNARAESYWHLRQKLEAGEIALPRDEMLFDELVATRWRPTSDGRVQIEGKDDLKARLGRSPDRADAVAMAFYRFAAGGREPGDRGITI